MTDLRRLVTAGVADANRLGGLPRYALGVLSPLSSADTLPHGLYRLLGSDFVVISAFLALQSFEDVDRATAAIDAQVDHLVARGASLILQSGTPLALSLGPEGLQRLLDRLHAKTGLPVLSSVLNAVAAVQTVNARRIAVANKWNDALNLKLRSFFAHWGIEILGGATELQEPSADLWAGSELAYALGRRAFEEAPAADALFIGGSAWLVEPAAERLEREFRRPVITSLNGAARAMLKELGCWRSFPDGYGRVLEAK